MKRNDLIWKSAYLAAALGVFLIDQATKAYVARKIRFAGEQVIIPDFLNVIYAQNDGIAFSQLQDGGDFGRWALSALAGLAAIAVTFYLFRTPKTEDRTLGACALLLAGIVGNLADRVRLGFVIDWIDVQFGGWHYPTFNVADAAICCGAFLLILDLFFSKRNDDVQRQKVKNN